jgi:aminoglycoside 6'-N-acetyltransferase
MGSEPRRAVHGALTVVRPAVAGDVDWLVAAHADPEVSRYWDDETYTRAEIEARMFERDVDAWIVEAEGERVGYLQSWWEVGAEPRRGGLDMFLLPEVRGRGLGPDAARALAESLLRSGWSTVTVDPYVWNEQAVRAWRRAGFVEVSRHPPDEDHTAEWILMRFERPSGRG